jgi:hypothetical protein
MRRLLLRLVRKLFYRLNTPSPLRIILRRALLIITNLYNILLRTLIYLFLLELSLRLTYVLSNESKLLLF